MKRALIKLVGLYPPAFRERFGADIVAHIEQDFGRARARGCIATAAFALATAWDLVTSAIAEHWNPTWRSARLSRAQESGMRERFNEWLRDIRHAARALRRSPGFTAVTVGTLGLAIGANAGMFTVVDTVLLNPFPYANADRLVTIRASAPGSQFPAEFAPAPEFFVQYRESKLIEDVSTYNSFTSTLRAGDRVERIRMSWPTNSLYSTLGVKPILGRVPVTADGENAVVISDALWSSWFNRDSSVIGKAFYVGFGMKTVVGIMGPEFKFPNDETMLWISSEIRPEGITVGNFGGNNLVARAAPGATPEAIARELTALSKRIPDRFGGSAGYRKLIAQHRAVVKTLEDTLVGTVARPLWVLLGAVGFVLLIACANVANLFLVRAEGRQRDLAVRRAIGAARGQLIRSQMAEAIVVAALAALVAAGLAAVGLPVFLRAAPPDIPRLHDAGVNATVVLFTLGAALLSALACGFIPAIRGSSPDLNRLRDGNRGATRRRNWARDGLVVGQTALALVLLIGSGLLVRSFWTLSHVNPGYSTEDIFTFQIAPEGPGLTDGPSYARLDLDFLDRLAKLPGVQNVGLVENIPLNEGTAAAHFRTEEMAADPDAGAMLHFTFTAGDYFKAMGISVRAGRPFDTNDHLSNLRNIVISRSAANLLWPGKNPLGRRLQGRAGSWETVVGVVDDVMQDNFRDKPDPLVYYPLVGPEPRSWIISSPAFVVKTRRAETIGPEIRALVKQVFPSAPMYRVFTMAGLAKDSMVQLSFTMLTLGIASALALILGAVGLYGVLSYVVAQRTREIGVRMALGAEAGQVRRMVVAQGARVVVFGVAIGLVAAGLSTSALDKLLFGVKPVDLWTFAGMSASMIAIGLLASYVPARRASRVDPIESLRGE